MSMNLKKTEDILDALRCNGYMGTEEQKKDITDIINRVDNADARDMVTLNSMAEELLEVKYSDISDFAVVATILNKYLELDSANKDILNKVLTTEPVQTTLHAVEKVSNDISSVSRDSSIFEEDVEKVYSVKYMEYTNAMKDTVRHNTENMTFINVGKGPFLIRESELMYYSNYGGGYESIDFVGMITKSSRGGTL